jgi:hypothetical protein
MDRFCVIVCGLSASLFVAACETPVNFRTADFDPSVDFDSYQSYAWISDSPMVVSGERPVLLSPLLEQRIMRMIEANLTGKGYAISDDPEGADLIVSFTIGQHDRIDIRSYPSAYRGNWGWGRHYWGYGGGHTVTTNYVEGALAIDFFDGAKKQPVWHGWATKDIFEQRTEDLGKEIKPVVDGILADFPPDVP